MREEYVNYSEIFDTLSHIGVLKIYFPELKDEAKKALKILKSLAGKRNANEEIGIGIIALKEAVEASKARISTVEFLNFALGLKEDEDNQEGEFFSDCLEIFDDLICIQQTVLDLKQELPLLQEVYAELENEVEKLVAWFTADYHTYRLVPFNETRASRARKIPKQLRYLFPWYEYYKNESPNFFFEVLAEELQENDIAENNLARININNDPVLNQIFIQTLNTMKMVSAANEKNPQIKFFQATRNVGRFLAVSGQESQVGLFRVCYYTLIDLKMSSEIDAFILGAVCAPVKKDRIKINLMKKVFSVVDNLPASPAVTLMQEYLYDRNMAGEVARKLFNIWVALCKNKAKQILAKGEVIVKEGEDEKYFRIQLLREVVGLTKKFAGCCK